jgi:hypothetical protein
LSGSLMVTMSVVPLPSAALPMWETDMAGTDLDNKQGLFDRNESLLEPTDNASVPDRETRAKARGGLATVVAILGTIRPDGFSRRAEYWLRTHQMHGQLARGAAEILTRVVGLGFDREGAQELGRLAEELRRLARIDAGGSGNAQEWERRTRDLGEQVYRVVLQIEEVRGRLGAPVTSASEPAVTRAYVAGVLRAVRMFLDCHDWAGDGGAEYWRRTAEILAGLAGRANRIVQEQASTFIGHLDEDTRELLNRAERGLRSAACRFSDEGAGIGPAHMRLWMQITESIGNDLLSVAGVLDRVGQALDRTGKTHLAARIGIDGSSEPMTAH